MTMNNCLPCPKNVCQDFDIANAENADDDDLLGYHPEIAWFNQLHNALSSRATYTGIFVALWTLEN